MYTLYLYSRPPSSCGGTNRDRTDDLLRAKQTLSQLSYGPIYFNMVPRAGVEPAHLSAPVSKTGMSTYSITKAFMMCPEGFEPPLPNLKLDALPLSYGHIWRIRRESNPQLMIDSHL